MTGEREGIPPALEAAANWTINLRVSGRGKPSLRLMGFTLGKFFWLAGLPSPGGALGSLGYGKSPGGTQAFYYNHKGEGIAPSPPHFPGICKEFQRQWFDWFSQKHRIRRDPLLPWERSSCWTYGRDWGGSVPEKGMCHTICGLLFLDRSVPGLESTLLPLSQS